MTKGDGVRDGFAAEPCVRIVSILLLMVRVYTLFLTVAGKVSISVHHGHGHSSVHYACESLERSPFDVITCQGERLGNHRCVRGKVHGNTEGVLDVFLVQVPKICLREGIGKEIFWVRDIEIASTRGDAGNMLTAVLVGVTTNVVYIACDA